MFRNAGGSKRHGAYEKKMMSILNRDDLTEREGMYKQNSLNSAKVNMKFGFLEKVEKDPGLKFKDSPHRGKSKDNSYSPNRSPSGALHDNPSNLSSFLTNRQKSMNSNIQF